MVREWLRRVASVVQSWQTEVCKEHCFERESVLDRVSRLGKVVIEDGDARRDVCGRSSWRMRYWMPTRIRCCDGYGVEGVIGFDNQIR